MSAMNTLLLRLQGPMQSWGTTSRFDERDTQLEPSKSGVIGLICAALGRDRRESIDDLAALRMGVRVDREGALLSDYHTVLNVISADGKKNRSSVGRRYYLSDAVFLVGLEGESSLLEQCYAALRNPVWPLALGRKCFVPSMPVHLPNGLVPQPLCDALSQWPSLLDERFDAEAIRATTPHSSSSRLLLENDQEGVMRLDQPIGAFSGRRFGPRFVSSIILSPKESHVS